MDRVCRICGVITTGVLLFPVPVDPCMYKRWQDVVQRNTGIDLLEKNSLCGKHFLRSDVKELTTVKTLSGRTYQRRLVNKRLEKDAVPSIFLLQTSDNTGPTKMQNLDEIIIKEEIVNEDESPAVRMNTTEMKDHDYADNIKIEVDDAVTVHIKEEVEFEDDISKFDIAEEIQDDECVVTKTYSGIRSKHVESSVLTMPSIISQIRQIIPSSGNWKYSVQHFPSKLILEAIQISEAHNPWCKKQIIISEDLSMKLYVMGKPFLEVPKLLSIENVKSSVTQVDVIEICQGGPEFVKDDNVSLNCAYVDCSGCWRHHSCALKVNNETLCKYCKNLNFCYIIRKSCHGIFNKKRKSML